MKVVFQTMPSVVYLGQVKENKLNEGIKKMARLTGKGSKKFYEYATRRIKHYALYHHINGGRYHYDHYVIGIRLSEELQGKYELYPAEYDFYMQATDQQWEAALKKAIADSK
jgi:hypothetical protein